MNLHRILSCFTCLLVLPALVFYAADTLVVGWLLTKTPRDLMMILMLLFHGYMCYSVFTRWRLMQQAPPEGGGLAATSQPL